MRPFEYGIYSIYSGIGPNCRRLPQAPNLAIQLSSFLEHRKACSERHPITAFPLSATFPSERGICSVSSRSRQSCRNLPEARKHRIEQGSFLDHRKGWNEPNNVAALFQNSMIQIECKGLPKLILLPRAVREPGREKKQIESKKTVSRCVEAISA